MTPALAPLAAELEQHLGLDPAAVGERLLARAVEHRVAATGSASPADYRARLSDAERAELAEEVVVGETWFLRYPESFKHLAGWAAGRGPVRVLSVPCSTGEEAYSVALTLHDAGVPGEVVGVDVSRRAVAVADAGVYADGAFRDAAGRAARDRHFDPVSGRWRVREAVRRRVTLRCGNLTSPGFLAGEPAFDAVFCRNLFIYLTPAARRAATANLLRLLAPGGVLYLGHAEPLGLTDDRVRPVPPPQAFAFERAARPTPVAPPQQLSPPKAQGRPSLGFPPQPPPARNENPLAAARAAADRGDPAAALALLDPAPPSAAALTLRGIAHAMAGDPAAADAALTQALYLDPTHADALLHRLALAEARGDATAAAHFRRRLARRAS